MNILNLHLEANYPFKKLSAPEAIKYGAVIYKPSLFVAVTSEAIKYVAVIYKPSLFVAVTPEAIKYVAVIYKLSLTCRHLQADHSGTQITHFVTG